MPYLPLHPPCYHLQPECRGSHSRPGLKHYRAGRRHPLDGLPKAAWHTDEESEDSTEETRELAKSTLLGERQVKMKQVGMLREGID
ncbi:hypothetical protein JTE90_020703 [Oedothorax gibbosus]|uniref:Uncharacterized protein n=1 Tax=Oedothorax gibbosus TaxID=931172 RepID=A0AAV6V5V9_9ARAC|nr:hypothetical protein JTE90_020703 [Oedothorax gibbosus]